MHELHRMLLSAEVKDLSAEVSRLFSELDRRLPSAQTLPANVCVPALDVRERDEMFEVIVDLPGVTADRVRVLIKDGVVLLVGEKLPQSPAGGPEARFHLVERGFGRFARAVRLSSAVDAGRARARLRLGELHVEIPKIAERRGQEFPVPVEEPVG